MPRIVPVCVNESSPAALAIPKSATLTRPRSSSSRFPGFTSRWTIPAACAESIAAAASSSQSSTCRGEHGTPRVSRCSSEPPGQSSITIIGRPSCSTTSKIVTMCGLPESRAAASASRLNRRRSDSSSAIAVREHLDRHVAAELLVGRPVDVGHAAAREQPGSR